MQLQHRRGEKRCLIWPMYYLTKIERQESRTPHNGMTRRWLSILPDGELSSLSRDLDIFDLNQDERRLPDDEPVIAQCIAATFFSTRPGRESGIQYENRPFSIFKSATFIVASDLIPWFHSIECGFAASAVSICPRLNRGTLVYKEPKSSGGRLAAAVVVLIEIRISCRACGRSCPPLRRSSASCRPASDSG